MSTRLTTTRTVQDRLRTLEELRVAIPTRKLEVHYQPKVDYPDPSWSQASRRWSAGITRLAACSTADAFLPLAEDSGLMRDLTMAVLEQSLDQVRAWRDAGRELTVAVNLSASSLVDIELPEMVWRRCSIAICPQRFSSLRSPRTS